MRPDYCPVANEPCQMVCRDGCRLKKRTGLKGVEMSDRDVMQQALEALVWEAGSEPTLYATQTSKAIEALRARLAEPQTCKPALQVAARPLTDEEIDRITRDRWGTQLLGVMVQAHREFARAIERAHKIGGNDE